MMRLPGTAGFANHPAPVASPRLASAIAASLAIGTLSLCLVVNSTIFTMANEYKELAPKHAPEYRSGGTSGAQYRPDAE